MEEIPGKITISRVTSNVEDDYIQIGIKDGKSFIGICTVTISLEDFAYLITGLGHMPCDIKLYDSYNKAGLKHITKMVRCRMVSNKQKQLEIVMEDYKKYSDKWLLKDDGTRSQQNGTMHAYIVEKYVKEGGEKDE